MIWFFFKHLPAKINKISHICKQKMPSHEDFAYLETSFAYFESRTPKMLQIIKFCKPKMLQKEKSHIRARGNGFFIASHPLPAQYLLWPAFHEVDP